MTDQQTEDYLFAWGHRLALCEWEVSFRVHEDRTPQGWAAESTIDHECLKAAIDLAGDEDERGQRKCLRHELLHLVNVPLERLFREATSFLAPQVAEVLGRVWDAAEEHQVRRLSNAFEGTLDKGEPQP